jgi:hypothetical protein
MNVYVIVASGSCGLQEYGVFATEGMTESHLEACEISGDPQFLLLPVHGKIEHSDTVYTAACYDASLDNHYFIGVYGNFDIAKQQAGERGRVLTRSLTSI